MNCVSCQEEFIDGERITVNVKETFVFKPAHIPDPEVFDDKGKKINLAAVKDPDEMRKLREEHLRTAVATIYATVGKARLPEGAFNPQHLYCGVLRTGQASNGAHPVLKHSVRFARTTRRGKISGGQY